MKLFVDGIPVLLDDDDYKKLSKYSWYIKPNPTVEKGYVFRIIRDENGKKHTIHMHREILNAKGRVEVDHINGNTFDNRKRNLRIVNVQKNAFNRCKPKVVSTSRFKSVLKRKNSTSWTARIKFYNKSIELGQYREEEKAAAVYNFAAKLLFGEYRKENADESIRALNSSEKDKVFEKCRRKVEQIENCELPHFYQKYFRRKANTTDTFAKAFMEEYMKNHNVNLVLTS